MGRPGGGVPDAQAHEGSAGAGGLESASVERLGTEFPPPRAPTASHLIVTLNADDQHCGVTLTLQGERAA